MWIRMAEDIQWRRAGGEVVILDPRTAQYFSLNATAALLWPLLADGATSESMATELERAFGIGPEAAARDVRTFLDDLRTRQLIATDG